MPLSPPTAKRCAYCGAPVPPSRRARPRRFCSDAHRLQFHRDQRDPEQLRAARAQWDLDHPERRQARRLKWKEGHPETVAAGKARWFQKHKAEVRARRTLHDALAIAALFKRPR